MIEAGADVDARSAGNSGGVPGGSALLHAAVFGMTGVLDLLVTAGARVTSLEEAAAAGDLEGWLDAHPSPEAGIRALVMAADHERLGVIDQLIGAGIPVDAADPMFGRHPLRLAAANGKAASVRSLLAHGANPGLRDEHGRTPLVLCLVALAVAATAGLREVAELLRRAEDRADPPREVGPPAASRGSE